ncbi:carbohydrate ABC transporter permease [Cohnella nanjingensis]|uniref:Sugar ABC transporter permease n=1 Tax=Cohnella nanjingensis TaxID=1387779 RepID=A0A7X0RSI5_9BACL|nr:sugar ABC transporter permease [Cohnella nanjingensis]MBB6671610.1 sugar ABC transporter permease [Cohnella nanjingensis]
MKIGLERRKVISGYVFILPWMLGFLAFLVYPLVMSFYMSLRKMTSVSGMQMEYIGWDNFSRAVLKDVNFIPLFYAAIRNAFVEIPLILVFSFFMAMLLNHQVIGRAFFRAVFFLPVVIGSGFVMEQLLGQGVGSLQTLATDPSVVSAGVTNGLQIPDVIARYLSPEMYGNLSDILGRLTLVFWKTGIQILLFLAGLQGISESLYESAKCDGATPWEMFWKITFPLMTPVLLLNAVFTLVDSFTDIRNQVILYIKQVAFTNIEMGYASALGWIYFVFVFILIVLIFAFTRKRVVYMGM